MRIGDTLTKDGWRYDGEKDFWTHPKRQGHIKITIQGWVHKVTVSVAAGGCDEVDIKARDDYRTVKEGFNETDLQEHLNSLQSLGKYAGRMAVYGEGTKTAILKSVTGILKFVGFCVRTIVHPLLVRCLANAEEATACRKVSDPAASSFHRSETARL